MLMYLNMMLFFSMLSLIMNYKHLLLMLLSLEFVIIILFFFIFIYLSELDYEFFFSMIFLTMSVCESVLGLSILILMIRVYGNDYMMSFSLLW